MKNWVATLILGFLLYFLPVKAMEDEVCENDLNSPLIIDLIFNNIFLDQQTTLNLSAVSKTLYSITSDSFWGNLYSQIHGNNNKLNESLTFKQNYILFHRVKAICYTGHACRMQLSDLTKENRWINFIEIVASDNGDLVTLRSAIEQKAKIYCTCWNIGSANAMQNNNNTREAFDLALNHDIIIVLDTGRHSTSYPSMISDGDLHQMYSNVIWTTQCDESGLLCPYANFGELIDIALVPPETGDTRAL